MLKFHAVFHFCIQINNANIVEGYIHYVNCKHYPHVFNIYGIHNFQ